MSSQARLRRRLRLGIGLILALPQNAIAGHSRSLKRITAFTVRSDIGSIVKRLSGKHNFRFQPIEVPNLSPSHIKVIFLIEVQHLAMFGAKSVQWCLTASEFHFHTLDVAVGSPSLQPTKLPSTYHVEVTPAICTHNRSYVASEAQN